MQSGLEISTPLSEIVVGTVAQLVLGAFLVPSGLGPKTSWISLLAGIIDQAQYSFLVATVIGSAVIPMMIANSFFMLKHLLKKRAEQEIPITLSESSSTPAD